MDTPKMIATLMLFLVFTGGSISLVRDIVHMQKWIKVRPPLFENDVTTKELKKSIRMDTLIAIVGLAGMLTVALTEIL